MDNVSSFHNNVSTTEESNASRCDSPSPCTSFASDEGDIALDIEQLAIVSHREEDSAYPKTTDARVSELIFPCPLREVFQNSHILDLIRKFVSMEELRLNSDQREILCDLCGKNYYLPELNMLSKRIVHCENHGRRECLCCETSKEDGDADAFCVFCRCGVCSKCPMFTCPGGNEHIACDGCFEDCPSCDDCGAIECMSNEGRLVSCIYCDRTYCEGMCSDEQIFHCDECDDHYVCEACDDLNFCDGCSQYYCDCTDVGCIDCVCVPTVNAYVAIMEH